MAKNAAFGLIPFHHGANLLGVHPTTARRLLRDPKSDFPRPTVQIGRRKYYRNEQQLKDWLDRQARNGGAPEPAR